MLQGSRIWGETQRDLAKDRARWRRVVKGGVDGRRSGPIIDDNDDDSKSELSTSHKSRYKQHKLIYNFGNFGSWPTSKT